MIDLSDELSLDKFKTLFVTGAVFHCSNFNFSNGSTQDKYVIVLCGNDSDGRTHFYLPTSKVDKYKDNKLFSDSLLLIEKGLVTAFKKDTAIITRQPYVKEHQYFKRKYGVGDRSDSLQFCCHLPKELLVSIHKKIMASNDISLETKKIILPSKYLAQ